MEAKDAMDEAIAQCEAWLNDARAQAQIKEPTAMHLATADASGRPSGRMVLCKHIDHRGFVFYTNHTSRKSEEIKANPQAALTFFWEPLARQIRIEGAVEPVAATEADDYFASRSHGSQVGAWASWQSQELKTRNELETRVQALEQQYAGVRVPRPPHWSGWRVIPRRIEFWQEGESRLHHRTVFERQPDGSVRRFMLYP